MTFIFLFSTFSFSVEKHFCGTHLVDAAIFSKAKKCGMAMNSMAASKKKCCKDELEIVKGQDDLKMTSVDHLNDGDCIFISVFNNLYSSLYESRPKHIVPFKDYAPPNLVVDIQLLDNVFLI